MWLIFLLGLSALSCVSANGDAYINRLDFYPKNYTTTGAGTTFPIWHWYWQDPGFFSFPMNVTAYIDGRSHACDPAKSMANNNIYPQTPGYPVLPGDQGRLLIYVPKDGHCRVVTRMRKWTNWAQVMLGAWAPQDLGYITVEWESYSHDPADPLLLFAGDRDLGDVRLHSQRYPPWYDIEDGMILENANVSLSLRYPRFLTGAMRQIHTVGTIFSFTIYAGRVAGIVLMIVGFVKYVQFFKFEGGVKLSIPQMVLSLVIVLGFDLTWITMFPRFLPVPIPIDVYEFFEDFGFPVAWTAVMIMGFYFREVSLLTSSSAAVGVLNKVKIPAIIVLSLMWAFFIITQIMFVVDPEFMSEQKIVTFYRFNLNSLGATDFVDYVSQIETARAAVAIVLIILCTAILVFGVISLLIAIGGASMSSKKTVIRISVLCSIIVIVLCVVGIMRWNFYICFCDVALGAQMTNLDQIFTTLKYTVWHHFLVGMAILIAYRVQESKEIEASKSAVDGTSSTSGSSSSSGGSSSSSGSSSAGDPVIEL